jgi:hypothetical protein
MSITIPTNEYLFGKGKVALAERDSNGGVSKILYTGNCPELKISGSADRIEHYESQTGTNLKDRSIVKTSGLEMSMSLESVGYDVLALLMWGAKADIAVAATQNYTFPSGVANNDIHIVPNGFNMTATSLKDSAGTPATVPTTKYNLDPSFGTIEFLDTATYTQPFKLFYDRGAAKSVPFFTSTAPTRFLRFEGLNLGNPGAGLSEKFLVELYIVQFDPVSDLGVIGDDFGKFELKGGLQLDDTRVSNAALGGYGRIVKL